jgi:hypothetical protein
MAIRPTSRQWNQSLIPAPRARHGARIWPHIPPRICPRAYGKARSRMDSHPRGEGSRARPARTPMHLCAPPGRASQGSSFPPLPFPRSLQCEAPGSPGPFVPLGDGAGPTTSSAGADDQARGRGARLRAVAAAGAGGAGGQAIHARTSDRPRVTAHRISRQDTSRAARPMTAAAAHRR